MYWIYPLVVMVVFLAVIEWTSRPRGSARGTPADEQDVQIPRPRKPAPGWTTSSTRRSDETPS